MDFFKTQLFLSPLLLSSLLLFSFGSCSPTPSPLKKVFWAQKKSCKVSKIKKLFSKQQFKKLNQVATSCLQQKHFKEAFLSFELILNQMDRQIETSQSKAPLEQKQIQQQREKRQLQRKHLQKRLGDLAFSELKDCEKAIKYYTDFLKPQKELIPSTVSPTTVSSIAPLFDPLSDPLSAPLSAPLSDPLSDPLSAPLLAPLSDSLPLSKSPVSSSLASAPVISSVSSFVQPSLPPFPLKQRDVFRIKYRQAECFFKLKKHAQALRELSKSSTKTRSQRKQKAFLKARILLNSQALSHDPPPLPSLNSISRTDPVLDFLERQIALFPEEEAFFREHKAIIYEGRRQLSQAIDELKKIKPQTAFIKHKIFQLSERELSL